MKAYLLSLPERVVRSAAALAGGLVREIGNVTVPAAVRRTSLYRNMVELTLQYLIEQVGQVEGVYPKAGELAHDFLLRRAAGHGVGWAAMLAFRTSPVWVTAALADLSGTGRHVIQEIADSLRQEGLLEQGAHFETVDQLLDGLERCSEQMTQVFTAPPLRVAELRSEWHTLRDEVRKMPAPHFPSGALLEEFWGKLRSEAAAQEKPVLVLAGGMALANLKWIGSASTLGIYKTSELLAGAVLNHYFDLLREIREEGFAEWWAREFRPYLRAAAAQFSRDHESSHGKDFKMTRRAVLGAPALLLAAPSTDMKVEELRHSYEDFLYRAPYKFGGREVDRVTMLNVHCVVSTRAGKRAKGFAAMPMGNVWSWPAPELGYDKTLAGMKGLADRIADLTKGFSGYAHPLEMNHLLEPEYLKAAGEIPKLCMLVTASPFDAALHDAFGKLVGRNAYNASGREFVKWDLSRYLGPEFRGEYMDRYVLPKPVDRVLMYHSVGASDALTPGEVKKPIHDGLPESLEEWIPYSGVRAIKIKLNGNDLEWDIARVAAIDQVARGGQIFSLDFNEKCPNVAYLLEFIARQTKAAFERVQYIEQPTARDLERDRANVMFEVAKRKPVVIDESLTGVDRLRLAREMGYSGAALKACKGLSQSLLIGAAVQKYKMFRCVQDLTCPGASFVMSAQLASHTPATAAVEANAREYVPAANAGWEKRYPGLFNVRNGWLDTRALAGPGLGT